MKYIVDGVELFHVGHDNVKGCLFFTKEESGSNRLIEIPYSFAGVISAVFAETKR